MKIGILGAGAFGCALAMTLAKGGRTVTLWGRDIGRIADDRQVPKLPGLTLPDTIRVTDNLDELAGQPLLVSVPTQSLAGLLARPDFPSAPHIVACCKGLDLTTGQGPTGVIGAATTASASVLTGPSFAADIARGLPTALTLASADPDALRVLQPLLTTDALRIYTSSDPKGAELGGALKNVIAIGCGLVMGAGLGESARAALMTRGLVEMRRFADQQGAQPDTLMGLSGFGDLVLTCCSAQSRNFSYGYALGQGAAPDATATVEGKPTAQAAMALAKSCGIDMPITAMVSAILTGERSLSDAMTSLLSRGLTKE